MTLFETVFAGNDAVFGLTEGAIDQAIAQHGADKAVSFPDTAYALPCYYAVTGVKVTTLAELKEALGVVKTLKQYNLDVDVHYANINKQQIDLCHENNIKVNVWTVNDQEIANTYAKYGVDFITSNWVKETY